MTTIPRGSNQRLLKPGTTLYVMLGRKPHRVAFYVSSFLPSRLWQALSLARGVAIAARAPVWIEHKAHPAHLEHIS